jgi:FkbH-like protein
VKIVTDVVLYQYGQMVKVLVVDLDNTLWGGVLGDVGVDGLILGGPNPIGAAYARFQLTLRRLKERGLLLAVVSKNYESNAVEAIREHPDMVLRPDDFTCIEANYADKVTNIRKISESLNLSLDSFVFLDDSAFERERVRTALPEVVTPELPEDPAQFLRVLEELHIFYSAEEISGAENRTDLYRKDKLRAGIEAVSMSLDEFLESLEMEVEFRSIDRYILPRALELILRSNQFNLTTRRHNADRLTEWSARPDQYLTFAVGLSDSIGDNGIVALVLAEHSDSTMHIESWIMSCRVLNRRLEEMILRFLLDQARVLGCEVLTGEYIPSSKNALVSNLYPDLGFTLVETGTERSLYELRLEDSVSLDNLPYTVK